MAKFRYKAVDSQGKEVLSTVEADSQGAAIEKIRAMKLTPKAIGMVKEDTPDVAATRPAAAKPKKKGGGDILGIYRAVRTSRNSYVLQGLYVRARSNEGL